jgi:NAD(P)H-dependent FMN reductase
MGCSPINKCEILVLIGSARKKSISAGIIDEMQRIALDKEINLKLIIPSLEHIPIFS